jgi:hypothetical protein
VRLTLPILCLAVSAAVIYSAACAGGVRGSWARCPVMPTDAYREIVAGCGAQLKSCPGLEAYLSDLDALCRALRG